MMVGLWGLDAVEWAQVGAPAFAAAAAIAAWRSAAVSVRLARRATSPALRIDSLPSIPGRMLFELHNDGGGSARRCSAVVAAGEHYAVGYVGLVRPGETVRLSAEMPLPDERKMYGVLMARDVTGNTWIWDTEDRPPKRIANTRYRRWRRRFRETTAVFEKAFPDVPLASRQKHPLHEGKRIRS